MPEDEEPTEDELESDEEGPTPCHNCGCTHRVKGVRHSPRGSMVVPMCRNCGKLF